MLVFRTCCVGKSSDCSSNWDTVLVFVNVRAYVFSVLIVAVSLTPDNTNSVTCCFPICLNSLKKWSVCVFNICVCCPCTPMWCAQSADGAGAVCHHHPGQQLAQAGARQRLQDRHLRLEEALPLPVCPAAHHHSGGELCPHHLDRQGDAVQHGTHDGPRHYE